MRPRDRLLLWLLMASAIYTVGPWTLTAQTPVLVATSGTAASPGAYTWFSGLISFFGRAILLRYSDTADDATIDVQGQSHYRHMVSLDGGQTWPIGSYKVPALRTSNEPLALLADTNQQGAFYRPVNGGRVALPGMAVGGQYSLAPNLPALNACKCPYNVISNGGIDAATNGSVLITGLPRNIAAVPSSPNYQCYWFGDVVQVSSTRWLSIVQMGYVGDSGVLTCECIESTDQGRNWAWVGTVATAAAVGGEGYSEPSMVRLSNGDLMIIARAGSFSSSLRFFRTFSTDLGRTWSNPTTDRVTPFAKSPRIFKLTGGDYVMSAGGPGGSSDAASHKGHGLFLETDPRNGLWSNCWDLLVHHNAMITDPTQQFDLSGATYSGASGYGGIVELAPNRILISYDLSRQAYGLSANPNRVYVVDVAITR